MQEEPGRLSSRDRANDNFYMRNSIDLVVEYENLSKHFRKKTYDKFLMVIYNNLLEWLVSQEEKSSTCLLDDSSKIRNEFVMDVIIQISMKTEITFIQKLYQDILIIINNNYGIINININNK